MKWIALYFAVVVFISNGYSLVVPKPSANILEPTVIKVCGSDLIQLFETICEDFKLTGELIVYLFYSVYILDCE